MQNINDAYKSGKKIYMMHAEEAEKIFKHLREWRIRQLVEYDIRQTGSLFRAAGMKSYATTRLCHEIKKLASKKARNFKGFPCFFIVFMV